MKTLFPDFTLSAALLSSLATGGWAQGGASRTWVSGVGDDANPGSRTAPNRTLAGAFSKVASGGEIDTLDNGDFHPVTITRSLTIDGRGQNALITTGSATDAFTVTATTTPLVVTLRNFTLNGAGVGLNGVSATGPVTLRLVNCRIFGFTQVGVGFAGADGSAVFLENCDVHDCAQGGVGIGALTSGTPPVQGNVTAALENVKIANCAGGGLSVETGVTASLDRVQCTLDNGPAFIIATGATATLTKCSASGCASGVTASGAVYVSGCDLVGNSGAGLSSTGGTITSFQNNRVAGNTPDGSATQSTTTR